MKLTKEAKRHVPTTRESIVTALFGLHCSAPMTRCGLKCRRRSTPPGVADIASARRITSAWLKDTTAYSARVIIIVCKRQREELGALLRNDPARARHAKHQRHPRMPFRTRACTLYIRSLTLSHTTHTHVIPK